MSNEENASSGVEDLEALQNEGKAVDVDGESIVVKPFTFGKLLKALKYLANIGNTFSGGEIDNEKLLQMFAYNGENIIGLLCLATGKVPDFFENISPDAGIDLALATWEVNKDFFVERLAPKIQDLVKATEPSPASAEEDGSQSSKPSLSTDTEEVK